MSEGLIIRIIKLLQLLASIVVLASTIIFNPYLGIEPFDGSNTLNIAHQKPSVIVEILNNEQNFYTYYFLLKGLFYIFGSSWRVATIFNYVIWLVSITVFKKILDKTLNNSVVKEIALLTYITTPIIAYYAFYPRMYSLMTLLVLMSIHEYIFFIRENKHSGLVNQIPISLALVSLHPTGILPVLYFTTLMTLHLKTKKETATIILNVIVSLAVFAAFLLTKEDLLNNVFVRGLDYVRTSKGTVFGTLVSIFHGHINIQILTETFYIIVLVFTVLTIRNLKKDWLLFQLALPIVLVVTIFLDGLPNSRHLIFLVPISLLAVFQTTEIIAKTRGNLTAMVLGVTFTFIMIAGFSKLIGGTYVVQTMSERICINLRKIDDGMIVTDYFALNLIQYCLNNRENVLIVNKNDLENISDVDDEDILLKQARLGGLTDYILTFRIWLENEKISGENIDQIEPLNIPGYVRERNMKLYFFRGVFRNKKLTLYELLLFKPLNFYTYLESGIYVFK